MIVYLLILQSILAELGNGGKGPVNLLPGPVPLPVGQPGVSGPIGPDGTIGIYVCIYMYIYTIIRVVWGWQQQQACMCFKVAYFFVGFDFSFVPKGQEGYAGNPGFVGSQGRPVRSFERL